MLRITGNLVNSGALGRCLHATGPSINGYNSSNQSHDQFAHCVHGRRARSKGRLRMLSPTPLTGLPVVSLRTRARVPFALAASRGAQDNHKRVRAGHVRLLRLRDRLVPAHQVRFPIRLQFPRGRGVVERNAPHFG